MRVYTCNGRDAIRLTSRGYDPRLPNGYWGDAASELKSHDLLHFRVDVAIRFGQSRSHGSSALMTQIKKTQGCLNFQLRRTSRQVSRYYDDALRTLGLRITQFNILAVLAQSGPISLTNLAKVLGMERSALARNLKPIARKGLVKVAHGEDRRTRMAELASSGKRKLVEALPSWNRAQNKLVAKLGPGQTALLIQVLSSIRTALDATD